MISAKFIFIPFIAWLVYNFITKEQVLDFLLFVLNRVSSIPQSAQHKHCLLSESSSGSEKLFSPQELAKFDGTSDNKEIYLAFLGVVYDVTKGRKHYGPDSSYSFFAGKDGTRAFVTGQFDKEGLIDDLEGLDLESFSTVKQWEDFYEKDYTRIGRVIGSYYDKNGCKTEKLDYVRQMYKKLKKKEEEELIDAKYFPPCNSEYNSNTQINRVWCSDMSGGIKRSWIGVPRQLFLPEKNSYRCACVKNSGPTSVPIIDYDDNSDSSGLNYKDKMNKGDVHHPRLKEYPNCDPESKECFLSLHMENINKI